VEGEGGDGGFEAFAVGGDHAVGADHGAAVVGSGQPEVY
jgi:hypothetical protein